MTSEQLKKANELTEKIEELECFLDWCSLRGYRTAVVKLKRKWYGAMESKEYELPKRLQRKVCDCVQEELELLREELKNI